MHVLVGNARTACIVLVVSSFRERLVVDEY